MHLLFEHGRVSIEYVRDVVSKHFEGVRAQQPDVLGILSSKKLGLFVTLNSYPDGELRGCIGFPNPSVPYLRALREAVLAAAFGDPRFPPVTKAELDGVVFELSVLSEPCRVKVERALDYPKKVKVGRDGLVIRKGLLSGLLLPQVPVEHGLTSEEFLSHACEKAGLRPDGWLQHGTKVYSFTAQVFREQSPNGDVSERDFFD